MTKKVRKVLAILGILCGVATIIIGAKLTGENCGRWQDTSISFGADFYTYSYEASAQAACNVLYMARILRSGLSYLLMTLGAFEALYFGNLTVKAFEMDTDDAVPQEDTAAPSAEEDQVSGNVEEKLE